MKERRYPTEQAEKSMDPVMSVCDRIRAFARSGPPVNEPNGLVWAVKTMRTARAPRKEDRSGAIAHSGCGTGPPSVVGGGARSNFLHSGHLGAPIIP